MHCVCLWSTLDACVCAQVTHIGTTTRMGNVSVFSPVKEGTGAQEEGVSAYIVQASLQSLTSHAYIYISMYLCMYLSIYLSILMSLFISLT